MVMARVVVGSVANSGEIAEVEVAAGDSASGWRAVAKTMDFGQYWGVSVG